MRFMRFKQHTQPQWDGAPRLPSAAHYGGPRRRRPRCQSRAELLRHKSARSGAGRRAARTRPAQQRGQALRALHARGADQHRPARLVHARDLGHHRLPLACARPRRLYLPYTLTLPDLR